MTVDELNQRLEAAVSATIRVMVDLYADELPQLKTERKPGKWIWNKCIGEYECSECGRIPAYDRTTPDDSEIDKYRYCRWCGSPMEVQNEQHDKM